MTKLGRYEVLNELGKGAMGVVYLAKDPVIGRLVAVKTIRTSQTGDDDSESREFRERFVREAQTAGILSHPNIVTIHDIGEDTESRTSFIAMEYIEGKNLKSLLTDKKKFTWDEVADLIAQIGEALDYAHRKGIIHRDIKPANIILTTDGKVKITDFGIAKVASSNLTTTGQFLGTPNYMSPEQVSGAPVDGRSDIFSLGVVLYEMLTSRKPFSGDNLTAISYKIVHEDFTPPGDMAPEVPHEFNPIVARAMAKDPWNRYQRGKDMALALYQLKAHLEEQKALHDLGTMVSAAENLPTLKLSNLQELAALGGRETGIMPPPVPTQTTPMSTPRPEPIPARMKDEEDEATAAAPALASAMGVSKTPAPRESRIEPPEALVRSEEDDELPELPPLPPPPPRPVRPPEPAPAPTDLVALAKAHVNPRWYWMVTAAAVGLLLLIVAGLALRARSVARPAAEADPVRVQDVSDVKAALDEAQKLFTLGKYEESYQKARQVLARHPNNQKARDAVQMAEGVLKTKNADAERRLKAYEITTAAKQALAEGRYDEAKQKAEEALGLDASNTDAAGVRDDADRKLAETKAAAASEAAAKKKEARARELEAKKKAAPTAPAAAGRGTTAPSGPAAPAAPAPTTATLRVNLESPAPEGAIMLVVNNQTSMRQPFSFKKGESRSISATFTVPAGSVAVRLYLLSTETPGANTTTNLQLTGGETRTLQLEYAGGKLSVRSP